MEGNNTNWKPNEQGGDSLANNATNAWRSQLDSELRKRVLARVIGRLKEYFPTSSQHDINLTAVKFEERTYAIAKDKSDYVRKLSEKMIMMEKKFKSNTQDQAKVVNQTQSLPTETSTSQQWLQQNKQSNANINPGSSDLSTQVPMTVSVTENVNIQIGEGIHINLLPGTQIQIQGRQEHVPQQQQAQQQPHNANFMLKQQLLNEKIRHTNLRPLQIQQQAQPHQTSSLSTIQHSVSPQSPALSGFQSPGKQTSNQQNSQLLPRYQFQTQRVSSSHQQQMVVSYQEEKKQKQEQLISQLMNGPDTHQQQGAFRVSSSQQNNTGSFQAMTQQSNKLSALSSQQMQNMSSLCGTQGKEVGQSQPMMLQQYKPQHHMQQQQPQNRSLHQHMDFVQNDTQRFQADQQIHPYQSQRASLANQSTSQDSTGKTVNVSGGNWQEETYQKIKALKEMYLPLLSTMLQRITEKLREIASLPPQLMESYPTEKLKAEKLKAGKSTIEHVIVYLNVQRNSVSEKHRDRFSQYEEHVLKLTKGQTMSQRTMQQQQRQLLSSHQSQSTQVGVSQSLEKGQINSRLASPSVSGLMRSQTTSPHSFQTRPKMEPKDQKNIMSSSGNPVVPSLTSNISSAQANMFQQQHQKPFHQMHQTLLHRKQQQQQQLQQVNQLHQTNEMNDVRMRQGVNIKAELLQQHLSSSQRQLLKPLTSSTQIQNNSSPATVNKPGTSSKSSGSSFVAPSPILGYPEKPISIDETPSSHAVAIQPTLDSFVEPSTQEQSPFTVPPEPITERPIDRLIKALQSSSPEALAESVDEISSVISLVDRMAGSFYPGGGSIACLGEDLSARTNFRFQRRNFMTQGETNPSKRLKRSFSTTPRDIASEMNSCRQFRSMESEVDSTASTSLKVNKIELGSVLMQEIKEINGKLIETLVEICNEDASGTIVTCSYAPVALSATFKDHYMSGLISQIQPLRILVPANYPYTSPILLEEFSSDASVHRYEDLSSRTRSRFSLSMRELSEPLSIKEIAQMWNDCARATMIEYAERYGGGTFSSKHGGWESVLRAS